MIQSTATKIIHPPGIKVANHAAGNILLDESGENIWLIMDDRGPFWTLSASGNVDKADPGVEDFLLTLDQEAQEEICTNRMTIPIYVGSSWAAYPPVEMHPYKDGYNHERVYVSRLLPDAPKPVLGEDGAALGLFPLNNLPSNLVPRVRARIEAYLNGPARGGKPFSLIFDRNTLGRKGFAPELYKMNREEISGWEEWIGHPRVQQKLIDERCFAPFNDSITEVTEWATPELALSAAQRLQRRA